MRAVPPPVRRAAWSSPWVVDGVVALLLAAITLAYLPGAGPAPGIPGIGPVSVRPTLLQARPLVWRRTAPVAAWAVVLAATVTWVLLGSYATPTAAFGCALAVLSVGTHGSYRASVAVGLLTAAAIAGTALGVGLSLRSLDVTAGSAVSAGSWSLGDDLRRRRAYTTVLEDRAARLERAREEHARRLVLEERAILARELHDVVAHQVSMIAIQAETGPYPLAAGQDRATDGFASIGPTARQALTEMRRRLGVPRDEPRDPSVRSPQPGLAEIEALMEETRRAGLPFDLATEGQPRPVPAGVALSACRIVQEAPTNVRKHAGAARATVVGYEDAAPRIRVAEDGRGPGVCADHQGHGLVGMRERAAMLGGHLRTGPEAAGGFAVTASLPLDPATP